MLLNFIVHNQKKIFWFFVGLILIFGGWQILSNLLQPTAPLAAPLVINEFVAANGTGLTDEDGDFSDWIEIYNQSDFAVNMAGWSLTDDAARPERWTFPDLILEPGQYLLVFASGKDRKSTDAGAQLHTNFKLGSTGEFLGLYNIFEQKFIDAIQPRYPQQFRDMAYGRDGRGEGHYYLDPPTPGQSNLATNIWLDVVPDIYFSAERGFYDTPFILELVAAHPDTIIRYTIDGAAPTETSGLVYTMPFTIDTTTVVRAAGFRPDHLPSSVNTHTYLFLDDVLAQPTDPAGFPDTWGTHQTSIWEHSAGDPVRADYEVDPDIVNHPLYQNTIKNDLLSIPALSIVGSTSDIFSLYANPQEQGREWEHPISVELIYSNTERTGFQVDGGLRIHGGRGREEYIPKHSFRLLFRGEYGDTKLRYPLFPNSLVETFDTLILRGGVNRSYAGQLRSEKSGFGLATYTRDQWLRESQIEMSGIGAHGIFVHLYLNGLYWGLYNIVERPDAAFSSSYFGGDESSWYSMNANGPINNTEEIFETVKHRLFRINELERDQRYSAIQELVDTTHFIDYILLNWYAGTRDWPHNNWYLGMQLPAHKIQHYVWDGEVTWQDGARVALGDGNNIVKQFFDAFIQYPDFQIEFADRLYKHLFNDGVLTDENSQARWQRINKQVERAIVGESARWGDTRYNSPITHEDWLVSRNDVSGQMRGNADRLVAFMREAGYYPPIDPPVFNRYDGLVTPDFELVMTTIPKNDIYYTVDGTDPRASVTGAVASAAKRHSAPLSITSTTQIKARALLSDSLEFSGELVWSALVEATLSVAADQPELYITEIMYNPLGGNDYEFVELRNMGNAPFDLTMAYFEGINYTFPTNTILTPRESIVLVRNPQVFSERYPTAIIGGVYEGSLSNKGEMLVLKDAKDEIITMIEYDDEDGWPISPDGRGDSLVIIDINRDPNDSTNWRASDNLYGSPGKN